ncbi:MAG: hypothetical protein H8D45_24290 [Bacteroidetes bacterium]|nr:hypothetical protein [Bacteroidota bacterium]
MAETTEVTGEYNFVVESLEHSQTEKPGQIIMEIKELTLAVATTFVITLDKINKVLFASLTYKTDNGDLYSTYPVYWSVNSSCTELTFTSATDFQAEPASALIIGLG